MKSLLPSESEGFQSSLLKVEFGLHIQRALHPSTTQIFSELLKAALLILLLPSHIEIYFWSRHGPSRKSGGLMNITATVGDSPEVEE
jgi:hypothetical protein